MSDFDNQPRTTLAGILIAAAFSLMLLAMSAYLFWVDQRVFMLGSTTEGVVIAKRITESPNTRGTYSKNYEIRYRFAPMSSGLLGSTYAKQAVGAGFYETVKTNDKVTVWFDPDDPAASYIDRGARWNWIICAIIALSASIGTIYLIKFNRKVSERHATN